MIAAVGACADDGLSPWALVGTWESAGLRPATEPWVPDTLVLRGGGRGRVALHVVEQSPGGMGRSAARWRRGTVEYRRDGDGILMRWCLDDVLAFGSCDPTWSMRGRIDGDGLLWVGPSSMTSSVSAQPWVRVRP